MADPGPGASDAKLVEDSLAGDRRAFGLLVERHRASVTRLLRAMFGNVVGVEDLVQDSFLRAYLDLERLRDRARFGAWVRSIAVNLARMELRSGRLLFISWKASAPQLGRSPDSSPEALAEHREWARRIRQAIAALPPAEREAIREVYLNELSHREAARELGTSVGAIKVRVHRGRRRLRQELRADTIAMEGPKEAAMIEVAIQDVLVKQVGEEALPQIDFSKPEQQADAFLHRMKLHRVVVLEEKEGERILPIWVGPAEGEAIVLYMKGQELARPITFDLMKEIFAVGQMRLQSAAVSRFQKRVFYGTLFVKGSGNGDVQKVDCRPSDAINLALRMEAPILVAPEVMEQLGVVEDGDDFLPREEGERWVSLLQS